MFVGHPSVKNDDSSAAPGRSSSFSSIHKALPSAFWPAASDSSGSITRSRWVVRCTIEPVAIRLADYLSGMRDNIRESCSAPPFRTISIAPSLA